MNAQQYEQNKRRLAELNNQISALFKKNSIVNETGERVLNFTCKTKESQYYLLLEEQNLLLEQIGNKQLLTD